jgi:hypothetical protein
LNTKQFYQVWNFLTSQMTTIMKAKNHDYAGSADPFANFTIVEQIGLASTEVGMMTRMTDKVSRIAKYLASGELKVKDEDCGQTLLDLANYCLLLYAYRLGQAGKAFTKAPALKSWDLRRACDGGYIVGRIDERSGGFGLWITDVLLGIYPSRDRALEKAVEYVADVVLHEDAAPAAQDEVDLRDP